MSGTNEWSAFVISLTLLVVHIKVIIHSYGQIGTDSLNWKLVSSSSYYLNGTIKPIGPWLAIHLAFWLIVYFCYYWMLLSCKFLIPHIVQWDTIKKTNDILKAFNTANYYGLLPRLVLGLFLHVLQSIRMALSVLNNSHCAHTRLNCQNNREHSRPI